MSRISSLSATVSSKSGRRSSRPSPLSLADTANHGQFVIHEVVTDQHGTPWVSCGDQSQPQWFRKSAFLQGTRDTFQRLEDRGVDCLLPAMQNDIRSKVDAAQPKRSAHVATNPGWADLAYVFGDGSVVQADNSQLVIVAFEPDPMFTPLGSLDEWHDRIGPLVQHQLLPLFTLGLALSGPLLRFAPAGQQNVLVELVGPKERGKTSLATLGMSVYGGNRNSLNGAVNAWFDTDNKIDRLKMRRRDGLLGLDEGSGSGGSPKQRAQFLEKNVFTLSDTSLRGRYGDPIIAEHARIALLSTTNEPLRSMISNTGDISEAVLSRMLTVEIGKDRKFGVLDSVPKGFENSDKAIRALRLACNETYGSAGRAFVERLSKELSRNENELRRTVERYMSEYENRTEAYRPSSARTAKNFALIAAAGRLARKWGIIPRQWGSIGAACRKLQRKSQVEPATSSQSAQARIKRYLTRNADEILEVEGNMRPLGLKQFKLSAGFTLGFGENRVLVIPTERFQARYGVKGEQLMRALKLSGLAKTEGGAKSKLCVKAPRAICAKGRVYFIKIGKFENR